MYQKLFHSQMRLIATTAASALVLALGASAASADTAKCIATINKATSKYELAVQKALGKCQDGLAKGKIASCPDAGATASIGKAQTSFSGSLSKDCGSETVASVGFTGLVQRCNGSPRNGLFCTRAQNCEGMCDTGGQPGEPCTNNNPDATHGGVTSCAGACSLNGVEIVGPPPNFGVVSCKGNGAEQCNLQHACLNSMPAKTTPCTINSDCPGATGPCVGVCTASSPINANGQCATDADCGGGALTCTGFGVCNAFPGHCADIGTCDPTDRCPSVIDDSAPFSPNPLTPNPTCVGGTHNGIVCDTPANIALCTDNPHVMGDTAGTCTGGACDAPLATIGDVTTCLECNSDAIASVATGFAWGARRPPFGDPAFGLPDDGDSGKSVLGCTRDLGKDIGKYFQGVRKATQKCTASLLKSKVPSCPDAKLTAALTKAQAKLTAGIAKHCGVGTLFAETLNGDGVLKLDPLADVLAVPNSSTTLGTSASTLMDTLATCSDGLTLGKSCATNCGNGQIDIGEDCDDGNVVDGDSCPANCKLNTACAVTGTKTVTFNVSTPAGLGPLGALKAYLAYDNTKVNIPGTGAAAGGSVTAGAFAQSVNDLDSAIIVVLDDPADIGTPPFTVQVNVCSGAAVTAADFSCLVQQAGAFDMMGAVENASGVSCSVTVM